MRNKRLIVAIAVLLLVVFMLSLTLVACKKKDTENDPGSGTVSSGNEQDPPSRPLPPPKDPDPVLGPPDHASSFKNAMEYFVKSMSGEYMSLDFTGYATVSGTKYVMSLKGNISEDDLELAATFKTEDTDEIAFALYVMNSRLFVQVVNDEDKSESQPATIDDLEGNEEEGEGAEVVVSGKTYTIYNIAEIDVNYLLSIVDKLPDKISELLNGISIPNMDLNIPSLVDMVIGLLLSNLSPSRNIVYEEVDGVEKFELGLDINNMLSPIIGLLGEDSIIGGLLPEGLDISFVSDLLNLVPKINGDIKATVDHGVLSEFSLELRNNDTTSEKYQQVLLGLDNVITFGQEKIDLGLSDELLEQLQNYQSLTLGNLNFDFTLELDTGDEPFDIGALIDAFMTSSLLNKEPMFGPGLLVLQAHADYKLEVKASLDTNVFKGQYEEVYDPSTGKTQLVRVDDRNYINVVLWAGENELIRANYLKGKLYLKVLPNGVNGFAEGGINVAIDLPLNEYITQLVELLTGYIDGFLGTNFRPETAASAILSSSMTTSGQVILSPSIQDIIVSVLTLLGMENCIDMGVGDKITVLINEDLFKAIGKLANIDIDLPVFGDLTIGLFKGGIQFVEINALDIITFRADNFLIGKAKIDEAYVKNSLGDEADYGTDINSIILNFALSLINNLDVSLGIDVSTCDSVVNLTPVVNAIMAMANNRTYLTIPITLDLSKYDGTFQIRLATNYIEDTGDGRILIEVITPNGDPLITVYNENSDTFVDLSGLGFMKFCLTNVNVFQILRTKLGATIDDIELFDEINSDGGVNMSSSATIENDSIGLAVESYFVTMILRMLTMDLGLDAGLEAELGFDGSVNVELELGVLAKLGLSISLGKESENEEANRIYTKIEACRSNKDYGVYNAIGAAMLVDSILEAQNLDLAIDIYNNNVDKTTHENKTRIRIVKSPASEAQTDYKYDNVIVAPHNSIVLIVYAGWSNSEDNAMVYAVLNVDAGTLSLKIMKKALDGISAQNLVNWILGFIEDKLTNIPLDLKGMLVGILEPIFETTAGGAGDVIEVPRGALPSQKPIGHECQHNCDDCGKCLDPTCQDPVCRDDRCEGGHHNCQHRCAICGKCTDANCQDTICVDKIGKCADKGNHHICNHKCEICGKCTDTSCTAPECKYHRCTGVHDSLTIDNLIKNISLSLSGSMDINADVNLNGPVIMNLLTGMLTELFGDLNLSSFMEDDSYRHTHIEYSNTEKGKFVNSLYNNLVKPMITKFATSLVSGLLGMFNADDMLGNIVNRFLPLSNVQDLTANISLTDGKLANISIIGDNGGHNQQGFGIYIFNRHADNVVSFENQATNIYFNRNFGQNLMDKFETRARKHTRTNWEVDSWDTITWTVAVGGGSVTLDYFNNNLGSYPDGEYVVKGVAHGQEITVNLTLDSAQIKSVKDIEVKAMRDIPNYVTVVLDRQKPLTDKNGEVVKDEDGNDVMVDVEEIISGVDIVCERAAGAQNASVEIGGVNKTFTITFEEEEITLDTLEVNAYDYVDTLQAMEDAGTIKVKVNDSFYRNLPADFNGWRDNRGTNVKELSRADAQVRQTYFVNVMVGVGTIYEQEMMLPIEFKPFDIYYIEKDGKHWIETDFIEHYYGQAFPEEITVVGWDGEEERKYTANAKWDLTGVTVDLKGGQYFAKAIINEGDYNEWILEGIEVKVKSAEITGLSSQNRTVTFDWKYYLYGGVDAYDCIPSLLKFRVKKGDGYEIRDNVPVTIDLLPIRQRYDELLADALNGKTNEVTCPVFIDVKKEVDKEDGTVELVSIYETNITVIVPSIKMSLVENVIEIDVSNTEAFRGLDAYFRNKSKMDIILGDPDDYKNRVTANVTWNTDDVDVKTDGEYEVTVSIGDKALKQTCKAKVVITGNNTEEVQ